MYPCYLMRGWLLPVVCALLRCLPVNGQDYSWWNDRHNWDGHTSWNQYLTISSSYFGPNALPVPEIHDGNIRPSFETEVSAFQYSGQGDQTRNLFTRVYVPLFNARIAFESWVVPIEFYEMDTLTRDLRASRDRDGKGSAGGDIYISSQVLLFSETGSRPSLLFECALRTASGTNLSAARFTDGPGYYFDVSSGKTWKFSGSWITGIRPCLTGGLYVYQTFDTDHLQNDALLYGAGLDLMAGTWKLQQSLMGYSGYLHIGDKPLVYRASLTFSMTRFDFKLGYQYGIRNYPYHAFQLGVVFRHSFLSKKPS